MSNCVHIPTDTLARLRMLDELRARQVRDNLDSPRKKTATPTATKQEINGKVMQG